MNFSFYPQQTRLLLSILPYFQGAHLPGLNSCSILLSSPSPDTSRCSLYVNDTIHPEGGGGGWARRMAVSWTHSLPDKHCSWTQSRWETLQSTFSQMTWGWHVRASGITAGSAVVVMIFLLLDLEARVLVLDFDLACFGFVWIRGRRCQIIKVMTYL